MTNFYVEFHFQTKDKTKRYVFPIFINSLTLNGASDLIIKTRIALSEKFDVISNTPPKMIIPEFNQDHFQRIYESKLTGKCVRMDVIQWVFNNYDPDLNLTFEQNMELIAHDNYRNVSEIASILNKQQFPVRIISGATPLDFEDCLVIDVVF